MLDNQTTNDIKLAIAINNTLREVGKSLIAQDIFDGIPFYTINSQIMACNMDIKNIFKRVDNKEQYDNELREYIKMFKARLKGFDGVKLNNQHYEKLVVAFFNELQYKNIQKGI